MMSSLRTPGRSRCQSSNSRRQSGELSSSPFFGRTRSWRCSSTHWRIGNRKTRARCIANQTLPTPRTTMANISSADAELIGLWFQLLITGTLHRLAAHIPTSSPPSPGVYLAYLPQCVIILGAKRREGLRSLFLPFSCGLIFLITVAVRILSSHLGARSSDSRAGLGNSYDAVLLSIHCSRTEPSRPRGFLQQRCNAHMLGQECTRSRDEPCFGRHHCESDSNTYRFRSEGLAATLRSTERSSYGT